MVVLLMSLFEIAKPTPASFVTPPLQYVLGPFSITFPVLSPLTSLRAQMSIFADPSSLEIIAVALSGRRQLTLSLVVRTFQAARFNRCLCLLILPIFHHYRTMWGIGLLECSNIIHYNIITIHHHKEKLSVRLPLG